MEAATILTKQVLELFDASNMTHLGEAFSEGCSTIKATYPSHDMFPKTKELCYTVNSLISNKAIVEQGENLLYICSNIVPISHFTFGLFALDCMDSIAEHAKLARSYCLKALDFAEHKDQWMLIPQQEIQQAFDRSNQKELLGNTTSDCLVAGANFPDLIDQII